MSEEDITTQGVLEALSVILPAIPRRLTPDQLKKLLEGADRARERVSKMSRAEKKELEDSARRLIKRSSR